LIQLIALQSGDANACCDNIMPMPPDSDFMGSVKGNGGLKLFDGKLSNNFGFGNYSFPNGISFNSENYSAPSVIPKVKEEKVFVRSKGKELDLRTIDVLNRMGYLTPADIDGMLTELEQKPDLKVEYYQMLSREGAASAEMVKKFKALKKAGEVQESGQVENMSAASAN
jgi:hypothetical protein